MVREEGEAGRRTPTRMDEKVVIIERCDLKRYNLINDVDLQGVGGRTRIGLTCEGLFTLNK